MKRVASLFAMLILLQACHAGPRIQAPVEPEANQPIITGDYLEKDLAILNFALSKSYELKKYLVHVDFNVDQDHFVYHYGGAKGYYWAHTLVGIGKICFNANINMAHRVVWHELAHIYAGKCKGHYKFERKWNKIAGKIYTEYYRDYNSDYYKYAVLRSYAMRDHGEDIATWVEYIKDYCYLNSADAKWRFLLLKKSDKRVMAKLRLLLEYHFITQNEFEKIERLLR